MENLEVVILKQYYKKGETGEIKSSLSVRINTLGGYMFLSPSKKSYGTLCRLAEKYPEMVVETNSKESPKVLQS